MLRKMLPRYLLSTCTNRKCSPVPPSVEYPASPVYISRFEGLAIDLFVIASNFIATWACWSRFGDLYHVRASKRGLLKAAVARGKCASEEQGRIHGTRCA